MPTNRKYRTRKRCNDDVAWQKDYLLHGIRPSDPPIERRRPLVYRDEHRGCFASSEAAKELWRAIKDAELAKWVKERPGTRPFFWWQADCPERLPYDAPERVDPAKSAAYLADHSLLTPGEKQALGI